MGILLNGASVQLGILYNFLRYELQRNGLAKLLFLSRLPKHKTQYVKFQTFVSLYLDFNGNIAKWSVRSTWNFI